MSIIPPAVIFVNNDLVDSVKTFLIKQLHIDETIDGYEFDNRIAENENYHLEFKAQQKRLMVIRSFEELDNRNKADVVIFIKLGMASVLQNNFGGPIDTYLAMNLHWGQLKQF